MSVDASRAGGLKPPLPGGHAGRQAGGVFVSTGIFASVVLEERGGAQAPAAAAVAAASASTVSGSAANHVVLR
ncbi:hypothetical protein G7Z17_g8708 [Cylindrodendrum hubeiense]|uniref:Uncharacterized protein n=1 Tax=Cylindrodendrum hubeiense TaxID=595255 RepID=A0A9P5H5E6_9HYPO|nr:hypothetical protein G7Z17_g8708 [Cylindrodendrum hubeiense]